MNIYFNPLDTACKSITGGIYREEELQLNLFFLSEEYAEKEVSKNTFLNLSPTQCRPPSKEACLVLGKDGEARQRFPMQKTAYGWTISFKIAETGLYFYRFTVEDNTPIFMGKDRRGERFRQKTIVLPIGLKVAYSIRFFPTDFARWELCQT